VLAVPEVRVGGKEGVQSADEGADIPSVAHSNAAGDKDEPWIRRNSHFGEDAAEVLRVSCHHRTSFTHRDSKDAPV